MQLKPIRVKLVEKYWKVTLKFQSYKYFKTTNSRLKFFFIYLHFVIESEVIDKTKSKFKFSKFGFR